MAKNDLKGISEEQIPAMHKAVETYINGLYSHLDSVNAQADTNQAFKGAYEGAVKEFVAQVCKSCGDVISQLLEISDDLVDAYNNYKERDAQIAANLRAQTNELNGKFTKYTRRY